MPIGTRALGEWAQRGLATPMRAALPLGGSLLLLLVLLVRPLLMSALEPLLRMAAMLGVRVFSGPPVTATPSQPALGCQAARVESVCMASTSAPRGHGCKRPGAISHWAQRPDEASIPPRGWRKGAGACRLWHGRTCRLWECSLLRLSLAPSTGSLAVAHYGPCTT
jgi:hypothetical protein